MRGYVSHSRPQRGELCRYVKYEKDIELTVFVYSFVGIVKEPLYRICFCATLCGEEPIDAEIRIKDCSRIPDMVQRAESKLLTLLRKVR